MMSADSKNASLHDYFSAPAVAGEGLPSIASLVGARLANIHAHVMSMDFERLQGMDVQERYGLIRALGPRPADSDVATCFVRDRVAAVLLLSQPYPADYEEFENAWADAMAKCDTAADLVRLIRREKRLGTSGLLELGASFIDDQIDAFNALTGATWAHKPKHYGTFNLGKTAHARLQEIERYGVHAAAVCFTRKPSRRERRFYPSLSVRQPSTIAFNTHPDMLPMKAETLVYLASHEGAHHVSFQACREEPQDDPFTDMHDAIRTEERMYLHVVRNFGTRVYRCLLAERIAYSLCEKTERVMKAVARYKPASAFKLPCEGALLDHDLKLMSPEWAKAVAPWTAKIVAPKTMARRLTMPVFGTSGKPALSRSQPS